MTAERPYSIARAMHTLQDVASDWSRVSTIEALELQAVYRYVGELETRIQQHRCTAPSWLGSLLSPAPVEVYCTRTDNCPKHWPAPCL